MALMRRALELPAPLDDLSLYVHQIGERYRSCGAPHDAAPRLSPHDVPPERLLPNGDLRLDLQPEPVSCAYSETETADELAEVRDILAALTPGAVRAARLEVPSARREPNAGLSFLVGPLAQLEWAVQHSSSEFFARRAADALAIAVPHLQRAPVLEACGAQLATSSQTHSAPQAAAAGGGELLVEQNTLPAGALRDPFIPRQMFLAGVRLSAFAALFMRQEIDALALPTRLYAVGRQYAGPAARPSQDVVVALFALCSNALQAARLHSEFVSLAHLYTRSVLPAAAVDVTRRAPTQLGAHEAGRTSILVRRPERPDLELAFVSSNADYVARRLCTRLFSDPPASPAAQNAPLQPVQLNYPHMVRTIYECTVL